MGRRAGNAVTRNRIRRRLRAAMADLDRERSPGLAPGAYLLTADVEASTQPYLELVADVRAAIDRACTNTS